jgi:hypothetical protein
MMNWKDLEGSGRGKALSQHLPERTETNYVSQDSRQSNPRPMEYEAGMPTAQPRSFRAKLMGLPTYMAALFSC